MLGGWAMTKLCWGMEPVIRPHVVTAVCEPQGCEGFLLDLCALIVRRESSLSLSLVWCEGGSTSWDPIGPTASAWSRQIKKTISWLHVMHQQILIKSNPPLIIHRAFFSKLLHSHCSGQSQEARETHTIGYMIYCRIILCYLPIIAFVPSCHITKHKFGSDLPPYPIK